MAVAAMLLSACALPPPAAPPSATKPVAALAPATGGPLAQLESSVAAHQHADTSGFTLLQTNEEALRWRLAAVDSARLSLDLQYYVWFGDKVGQLLMTRVLAAADRGVRVRILFDDLNTLLHDMTHVQLRDALLARIDSHPQIEIRLFNAWHERGLVGRAAEMLWDFERLNRRMHNKQLVADNRLAIIGGRNIGDEYFGLNPEFNFHDLDVLGVGPVARQASAVFDRYWNSAWVQTLASLRGADSATTSAPGRLDQAALAALEGDARGRVLIAGGHDWAPDLSALAARLAPGRSTVQADPPARDGEQPNRMPATFRTLLRSARSELLLTNAYLIPDATLVGDLQELVARGVRVRVLTNSLASHDVPAVNSHYETWRRALLDAGVELREWRSDAAVKRLLVDTAPVVGGFAGLHTKAMVVDRRHSFVGSMNMDPRSKSLNAEMGIVIDSPPLAAALAAGMERDMRGDNSWLVRRDDDGRLQWIGSDRVLLRQPARNAWQRLENLFFKLLPPKLY